MVTKNHSNHISKLGTMSSSYVRTIEDVKSVITHAKLTEDELNPLTQAIYLSTSKCEELKLLELNNQVISSFKEGQRVVFKGDKDDKAVLCTGDKTFDVKEAETSNSLLLIPKLKMTGTSETISNNKIRILEEAKIIGVFHAYLELRPMRPRLRKLQQLLADSLYCGSELEADLLESGVQLCSTQFLLEHVQASEIELRQALHDLGACCIDGNWRLLGFEYHFRVLSEFLNLIDSNSWNISSIPFKETIENLEDLMPKFILEHIFEQYTEISGDRDDEGEPLYALLEDKTCRFLAEVLLRSATRFNLQDFLQAWQDSVPEGLQTDLKQLEGLAMIDLEAKPQVIWYYPESELPEDIQDRINVLFQVQEKWTLEQIQPYIVKLANEKQNVNSLLTKYSRSSNIGGVRYYSSRHGR